MKKTTLFQRHEELGGKMIDFAGWSMPVQYRGIIEEHEAVRRAAGLFDVSHMGEFLVGGPDATRSLQNLMTNDLSRAAVNQAIYSLMCQHDGGTVDDLLLYRLNGQDWLLVVNAANTSQDESWIRNYLSGDVFFADRSGEMAQMAIQGPKAEAILQSLTDTPLQAVGTYRFLPRVLVAGCPALVSRTGYTGEDGFEIYLDPAHALAVWDSLLAAGHPAGLVPAGLGARDTLRFEAGLPLYGQELSLEISPLEAGLDRFVKLDKGIFIGRDALFRQKEQGLARKRAGLEMIERGVPRSHYQVMDGNADIGFVTSGGYAPTLKKNLAMALLDAKHTQEGTPVDVVIRGQPLKASVTRLPFYHRSQEVR
jgi:aminomethyltransferase